MLSIIVLLVILETFQTGLSGALLASHQHQQLPKGGLVIAMLGPNALANTTLPIWLIYQFNILIFNLFWNNCVKIKHYLSSIISALL